MKSRLYFLKAVLAGILIFFLVSCGQDAGSGKLSEQFSALKPYQAQKASFRLLGQIPDNGDISIKLHNDQKEEIEAMLATSGDIDFTIDEVNANEIYFLVISGVHEKKEYWAQEIPLFVKDGTEFELVANVNADVAIAGVPYQLKIVGGGEEQQFLEEWNSAVYNQVIPSDEAGILLPAFKNFNQEFIEKNQLLISTFYLISQEQNYREHLEAYSDLYLRSSAEVQNSKYGVDFANHVHRITHAPNKIDFSKTLTARSSRLLPFEPEAFAEKEYLVLYIWASWEPKALAEIEEVERLVGAHENAELLYFSLDTRMSDWKPLTDQMGLKNSYMVRAESRQASIDQLYLTQLPRIIIVRPDGQIVEQDLNIAQLEAVLASL